VEAATRKSEDIKKQKFTLPPKREPAQLTMREMLADIRNRKPVVQLLRLTKREIAKWTKR
jgi:hypothetical protein